VQRVTEPLSSRAKESMAYAYAFEEVGDDLPRPPLAAMRALLSCGISLAPAIWRELPIDNKRTIALEGTKDPIDSTVVRSALRGLDLGRLKLVQKVGDPSPSEPPVSLVNALGPHGSISPEDWRALYTIDRFVLAALVSNTRVLTQALEEISRLRGCAGVKSEPGTGDIAHCEIVLRDAAVAQLRSGHFLEGRAFLLARAAGTRAARAAPDLFDLHSSSAIGRVELDWTLRAEDGILLIQAHASTWDGAFAAAASLLAATAAATAIIDMVRERDSDATIVSGGIRREQWQVGSRMFDDDPTVGWMGSS
jgi:molybdenum cofactor biosynthesis enzyme